MTKKPVKESTSVRIASIAARGMNDPKSLTELEIVAVCASALTQFERKAVKARKKARKG